MKKEWKIKLFDWDEKKSFEPKQSHHGRWWQLQWGGGLCHQYHTSNDHQRKFATTSYSVFLLLVVLASIVLFCDVFVFINFKFSLICVNERLVQVNNAVDHVQRGTSALQNAKKLQKNSRKWMCIAIIILLIIVAIIVVGVLKPWKSS